MEAPLAYLCATLYRRTLSGESSLTPEVENQLVTGPIHQLVAAGLFHQGDREQKKKKRKFRAYVGGAPLPRTLFSAVAHPPLTPQQRLIH